MILPKNALKIKHLHGKTAEFCPSDVTVYDIEVSDSGQWIHGHSA
jgi:hypothetical protein